MGITNESIQPTVASFTVTTGHLPAGVGSFSG